MTDYRVLREDLGHASRFSVTLPDPAHTLVDIAWSCGCTARGPDLRRVELTPCAGHAATIPPAPGRTVTVRSSDESRQ